MTDRGFLWVAVAAYAGAGLLTVRRLRGGGGDTVWHRLNVALLLAGFVAHTAFLYWRGQAVQRCPLTNTFEVQAFVAWAMVLFYLLIGPAYRVSLLGAFTAPVALAITALALLLPVDVARAEPLKRSPWVELHAAIAILAWGAFAVAAIIGVMYLVQRRLLKTRQAGAMLFLLPALDQMEVVMWRLLALGSALYTVGMVGGAISQKVVGAWPLPKVAWVTAVWLVYAALVLARAVNRWHGRRFAVGAIVAFVFSLVGFWGASWLAR